MAGDFFYSTLDLRKQGRTVSSAFGVIMNQGNTAYICDNYGNYIQGDILYAQRGGETRAYFVSLDAGIEGGHPGHKHASATFLKSRITTELREQPIPADGHTVPVPGGVSPFLTRILELEADQSPYFVIGSGKPPRYVDPKLEAGHGLPPNLGKPKGATSQHK